MAELNAKQMRQLLQSISTDPQLKQSKDSILLAEDQYPEVLDAVFARLTPYQPSKYNQPASMGSKSRRVV
jgi:hypothetical protein